MSDTRVIIDFHGDQAVGKTLLARAIRLFLERNGIQVKRRQSDERDTLEVTLSDDDRRRVAEL